MGEQDWLDHGHGSGEGLQPMIKASADEPGSSRHVFGGTDAAPAGGSARRNKALVGWLLYCCTAVGGSAAAWTVRETLFPSLGAPTTRSVWENSTPGTSATADSESTSSDTGDTSLVETTAVTASELSLETSTVPSASLPGAASSNTIDNHGSRGGNGPETGTTVSGNASDNGSVGPVVTVDNRGSNTSTPGSVTTDTSSGHQSGKGGGGSGGGGSGGSGGSGGGGSPTSSP